MKDTTKSDQQMSIHFSDMFSFQKEKGSPVILVPNMKELLDRSDADQEFSRAKFLFSCRHLLTNVIGQKDCINLEETGEYIEHITTTLMTLKSDETRTSIYDALKAAYGNELHDYGEPAMAMYKSLYRFCLDNKIWEMIKSGPWSWPLFLLTSFVLKPTIAFNTLEKHWGYDNGMKERVLFLVKLRDIFRSALKSCEHYGADNGRDHLLAVSFYRVEGSQIIISNKSFSTDSTMGMLDNMIYLGNHPNENCATNFNEVLQYMELTNTYTSIHPKHDEKILKIADEDCLNFMKQALHYYCACFARQKAEELVEQEEYGENAVENMVKEIIGALQYAAAHHNEDILRRQEEEAKRKSEEKAAKEEEMRKQQEKIKARHLKFEKDGFRLYSENFSYEKWIKESGNQSIDRFFIKASTPNDRLKVFQSLEELGLSSGRMRKAKPVAGVVRYMRIGDEEIGTDTLVQQAFSRVLKTMPPSIKPETLDITDTLFTIAYDKAFFSLEELEKGADAIKPKGITISDIRGLINMMRDRGIIGQIKTKKKGAKVFALTAEGMVLARNRTSVKFPLIHAAWAETVGEVVNEKVGKNSVFDVVTTPVKNIDAMIEGKTPKFLGKYYVTEL